MVTRVEYNKALDVIELYHKQFISGLDDCRLKKNKTELIEWSEINNCSTRLRNGLINYHRRSKFLNGDIIYVEDVTKRSLRRVKDIGKLSWKEFFNLRGY